jgi:hypothetical protein
MAQYVIISQSKFISAERFTSTHHENDEYDGFDNISQPSDAGHCGDVAKENNATDGHVNEDCA